MKEQTQCLTRNTHNESEEGNGFPPSHSHSLSCCFAFVPSSFFAGLLVCGVCLLLFVNTHAFVCLLSSSPPSSLPPYPCTRNSPRKISYVAKKMALAGTLCSNRGAVPLKNAIAPSSAQSLLTADHTVG